MFVYVSMSKQKQISDEIIKIVLFIYLWVVFVDKKCHMEFKRKRTNYGNEVCKLSLFSHMGCL